MPDDRTPAPNLPRLRGFIADFTRLPVLSCGDDPPTRHAVPDFPLGQRLLRQEGGTQGCIDWEPVAQLKHDGAHNFHLI